MTEIIIDIMTSEDISVTGHHMTCFYWCTCVQSWLESAFLSLSLSLSLSLFLYISAGIDRIWLLVLFVTHFIACCWSLGKNNRVRVCSTKSHTIQIGRQPHISVFTEHWLFDGCVGIQQCVWYLSKATAVPFFISSHFVQKFDAYQYTFLMNKNL